MTNAQIFTDLLFYAYMYMHVGKHKVRRLVFDIIIIIIIIILVMRTYPPCWVFIRQGENKNKTNKTKKNRHNKISP